VQQQEQTNMMHSENIAEISAAMAKAQGAIEGANKNSTNPHFKNKYADLAAVWDACREPLSANGLAVLQIPDETPAGMMLVTMITHSSGQWFRSSYSVRPVKNDPQGVGGAITYARRYTLMAMVGIAPEDDDGEAAMGRGQQQPANVQPIAQKSSEPAQIDRKVAATTTAALVLAISQCNTADVLSDWWKAHQPEIKALPADMVTEVKAAASARKELLNGEEAA
jgi:hypothetical protein